MRRGRRSAPYVTALITLDERAFARWKQRQGKPSGATIGELREDPDLRAVVQQAVDRANAAVSRPETIKRLIILTGPFQVGAELTPHRQGPQRLRAGQVRQRHRRPLRVTWPRPYGGSVLRATLQRLMDPAQESRVR